MKQLVMCIIILSAITSSTLAHTPHGGLTVCVSPDGKTIVAGGDNRVLYVIDPSTLEVTNRVWVKTTIWGLTFSPDGSKLLIEDTNASIFIVNSQSWTIEKEVKNASFLSPADKVNLCAVMSTSKEVSFLTMSDGSLKGKVTIDKEIASFAINPDGTRLAILTKDEKDESEKTITSADIPKDLKNAARREFEQKNNGKTAQFIIYEAPSGKELFRSKVFYTTSSGATMMFDGQDVIIVNYSNENARITAKGEVTVFELANSFNYGIGMSRNHSFLATGGLSTGTYTKVKELGMLSFTTDKLPGWPEYFKGFGFAPDGTAFGSTSGYRIVKIKQDGSVEKSSAVY